jgi:REP-associated tyrosine transposase
LMGNHYHLLIETPEGNLARGMRQLNGIYTQKFNRNHNRVGHLFQGRYKAILVEKESYLLELCRYIVLNPVKAGMAKAPEDWEWSSFMATSGLAPALELLSIDWILSQFESTLAKAQAKYVDFVYAEQRKAGSGLAIQCFI